MKVIIFGYSENKERYSYMAAELLRDYKHEVITINPRVESEISRLDEGCDTLTIYVNSKISDKYENFLLNSKPRRVIFNPGTENSKLQKKFEEKGSLVVIGCTLVLLKTNQFD